MEQEDSPKTSRFVVGGLIWLLFTVVTSTAVYMMASPAPEGSPG